MTNRFEAPKENQWSVEKSGVTCCVQVLQSSPLSKCLQAVLNKVQLQQIVCACDNYNRFNLVYFDTVKRTWWKPKNISIFGRSSCYVGLFGAAIFLGIFGGGIFLAARYFRSTWPPTPGMACLCCVPRSGPIEGRLSFAGGFRVRWIFAKLTYLPSNLLTIHSQPWGVVIRAQWG